MSGNGLLLGISLTQATKLVPKVMGSVIRRLKVVLGLIVPFIIAVYQPPFLIELFLLSAPKMIALVFDVPKMRKVNVQYL